MTQITYRDWTLDSDVDLTRAGYETITAGGAETCDCAGCRNFLAQRDSVFPAEVLRRRVNSGVCVGIFMPRILIIAILLIAPVSLGAQSSKAPALGWDLTYKTVLNANNVAPGEWIRKWLGLNYESRAKVWISSWSHGPIQSSILIEFPAPHAGERIILWFVRTKDGAFYYERAEGNALLKDNKPPRETHQTLDAQACDNFFSVASRWQQGAAVKPENSPAGAIPGYDGFLSVYDRGNSRQMLLTQEDYAVCDDKKCENWKPGRLLQALELVPRFATK